MRQRMHELTPRPSPARLAAFWLGIQAVWGAVLGISLQARSIELGGAHAIGLYGAMATTGAATAAIVQIAAGSFSDARRRRGSKRIEFYAAGAAGGALALAAFYHAGSVVALMLSFIALQAALNVAIGPYQAIIPDAFETSRQGGASSWMAALQSIGNAAGALCATAIVAGETLALALDGMLLATFAITASHLRVIPLRAVPPAQSLRTAAGFVDLWISRALVYAGFYTLLGYLAFYVSQTLGSQIVAQTQRQTGILILIFTIVGALGAACAARPSERRDQRLIVSIGGAVVIAGLMLFIAAHSYTVAIVATLVAGFGWGIFLVADWALACRIVPPGALGTAMGIWNLALIAPQLAAPAITTLAIVALRSAGTAAGPREAFGLAGAEVFIGILWVWRLSRCAAGQ
jgi:MFS family permease